MFQYCTRLVASRSGATRQALARARIDALYGDPVPGLPVVPVASAELAALLAAAHERVHGRRALVARGDEGELASAALRLVDEIEAAPDRRVDADLAVVARIAEAERPMVLAGPGVVAAGAVPGLHALATAGSLGVLNTCGAKGVFDWRSPHHLATAGLQEQDFALGGCADTDLVVATGIDEHEAPSALWQTAPNVVVAPGSLDPVAELLERPKAVPVMPPLRTALAAVTQEGWASTGPLLAPTQVTLAYSAVLGMTRGMVAADPGWAGYWVARTFPTVELGSAVVPAEAPACGFATACALVARLRNPLRPVLACVDLVDERTQAVLELAGTLGVGVGVEVWADDGDALDPDAHGERLRSLAVADAPTVVTLATDAAQRRQMVDAAGPVIAWGGLEV